MTDYPNPDFIENIRGLNGPPPHLMLEWERAQDSANPDREMRAHQAILAFYEDYIDQLVQAPGDTTVMETCARQLRRDWLRLLDTRRRHL
jgi:hypothetical protein